MIETRKATVLDFEKLLILIKNMNNKDKEYLRYNQSLITVTKRLLKNVIEDHVVVFTDNNEPFGFLEYAIQNDSILWVYSLYYKEEYRSKTLGTLLPLFIALKNTYSYPIHYTIEESNKPAMAIATFIKAQRVQKYSDGRVEYKVEVA